jgi:hypothetical protein
MEIIEFIECGIKRKGSIYICNYCNNTFVSRINSKRKFCSKACASLANRNRCELECSFCKSSFEVKNSKLSTKSGLKFCSRECKDKAQSLEYKILEIDHYGKGEYSKYAKRARKFYGEFCEICKYQEHKGILEVHHIDFIRSNNSIENLIVLCPNHHAMITRGIADLIDRKLIIKGP